MTLERHYHPGTPPSSDVPASEPRRRRGDMNITDYILPVPLREFSSPLLTPSERTEQPIGLLELVRPHLPLRNMYAGGGRGITAENLQIDCNVVLVPQDGGTYVVVVQDTSPTAIVREVVDLQKQAEVQEAMRVQFPDEYGKLVANAAPDDPRVQIMSGWPSWIEILRMQNFGQAFNILSTLVGESTAGQIRIENHRVNHSTTVDTRGQYGTISTVTPLPEERLVSQTFICTPEQIGEQKTIRVDAHLPWYDSEDIGDKMFDMTFYISQDRLVITPDQLKKIRNKLREEKLNITKGSHTRSVNEMIYYNLQSGWRDIVNTITRREQITWHSESQRETGPHVLHAFGQEMVHPGTSYSQIQSLRIFDNNDTTPTLKDLAEVAKEIYMTPEEVVEQDQQMEEWRQRWVNEILPTLREWKPEQAERGAEYLRERAIDPVALVGEKLKGSTRLVVMGMRKHPLEDDLVGRLIREVSDIDFIAIDARKPGDQVRALRDEKGMTKIELEGGIIMEMSHEEARSRYPDKYRDPDKPSHGFDSVTAKARLQGKDVVYAIAGDAYADVVANVGQRIGDYMRTHPQAKGLYLSNNLLHAIKWPGYNDEEGIQVIGFNRPFVNVYSLADSHYNDTKTQLPAHNLDQQFPGEVYSVVQFDMPKGFGTEWRNLRQSVRASGIAERFALDSIADSPFAAQRYLIVTLAELEGFPEEELWQFIGSFCGPVEIQWGKLVDGVIVYPSDEPEPRKVTNKELIAASMGAVLNTIKSLQSEE